MRAAGAAFALTLLAAGGCGGAAGPSAGRPPDVLLLVIDCLRADRLSAHGYRRPTTANLDALVAEGTSFQRAISQASWTRPSLPTILTGLYPSEHTLADFFRGADGAVMSARLADEVVTLPEALAARGYRTALVGEQAQLSRRFGLDQGFDFYRSHVGNAGNIHQVFLDWLDAGDGPAFAYLHYLEVHWPYCPPKRVRGVFDRGPSAVPACRDWRQVRAKIERGEIVPTADDVAAMSARYDEELLALDHELGRLFAELKARGRWDETLIVVTADHGEQFFEHGGGGHGSALWQELIAVPLIFKPPASWRAPRGARPDPLVEIRALVPTVLEAAGAPPIPAVSAPSLVPWIAGRPPSAPPQPYVVAESVTQVALRAGDLKLIAERDGRGAALYDLAADPGETRDVAGERRRELAAMRDLLARWERGLAAAAPTAAEELDPETEEQLRALGYLGG